MSNVFIFLKTSEKVDAKSSGFFEKYIFGLLQKKKKTCESLKFKNVFNLQHSYVCTTRRQSNLEHVAILIKNYH